MRLSKFLLFVIIITSFCLLYIYQQTEIFRLAYVSQKKQTLCQDLLDKNNILRYNIKNNTSLVQIGYTSLGYADYEIPDTYQLVRLPPSGRGTRLRAQSLNNKQTLFSRFFGIKRRAEAKTVYP